MSDANSEYLSLAADFPAVDQGHWRRLVDAALKGASFDKRLVSHSYDELRIEPIYSRASGANPVLGREPGKAWTIMQRIDHPDPKAANAQILEDLANGATGLMLVFVGSINANGYGLNASSETLAQLLEGISLDAGIAIDLDVGPAGHNAIQSFVDVVKHRNIAPAAVDVRIGLDPIGVYAKTGVSPQPWLELSKVFANNVCGLTKRGFRGPFAVADGRIIHNAGGSEAQELAFALTVAVAYLRALEAAGVSLEAARAMIYFRLAADADEFLNIAKFRAIRKLWARVEESCDVTPKPVMVAAETAWRMMTKRDAYVNMLRNTIAAAAAGLGGADHISALPHTTALGLPDSFARRVARNTQLILLEESHLAKIADPTAGSGAIEHLTTKLCHAAWTEFQKFEKADGAWAALEQGIVQREVATVREKRQAAVAHRKDTITGTSDYPNLNEEFAQVLNIAPIVYPKEAGVITSIEPLPSIRLAEAFESLRDKSDAILAKTGNRPKVFLANLGKLSDFTARATFAKNFYEAGGIEAVTNDGFIFERETRSLSSPLPPNSGLPEFGSNEWAEVGNIRLQLGEVKTAETTDLNALVDAYKKSKTKLACLCSSGKVYESEAAEAAKALTDAGAIVHLADRPGDHEQKWRHAGVKAFIFAGCDVLSTLQAAHESLFQTDHAWQ